MGKGSIVERLVAADPRIELSRSWTTRARRPQEGEDAYHFVSRPAFEQRRGEGGFIEWNEHFGNLYGTPRQDQRPGYDLLLEIEVSGAEQVRAAHPEALVIFIATPSRDVQAERLRGRGESEEQVAVRLARAPMEEERGLAIANHVVVNDDLDRAVAEVAGIVETHRTTGAH